MLQSHVEDGQYLTTYTIEPMLELLWTEDATHEDTRYKVLLPVTTPLLSQPPQLIDSKSYYFGSLCFLNILPSFLFIFVADSVPEEQIFKVLLGPFGSDVALMNITFPSEVLSVADCHVRGFNVLEHASPNGSSKVFTLEVPFTDRVVLQMVSFTLNLGNEMQKNKLFCFNLRLCISQQKETGITVYSLHLTFGLLVLPEFTPFSHTAHLEARIVDIGLYWWIMMDSFITKGANFCHHLYFFFLSAVPPSVSGGCDHQNYYILVKYGTPGFSFQTVVGQRTLTSSLAQQYGFKDNGTHFSFTVPFNAPDVVIAVRSESDLF